MPGDPVAELPGSGDGDLGHPSNPTLLSPACEPQRRRVASFRCECGAVYTVGTLTGEGYSAVLVMLVTCQSCLAEYAVRFSDDDDEAEVSPVEDEANDETASEDDPKDH